MDKPPKYDFKYYLKHKGDISFNIVPRWVDIPFSVFFSVSKDFLQLNILAGIGDAVFGGLLCLGFLYVIYRIDKSPNEKKLIEDWEQKRDNQH